MRGRERATGRRRGTKEQEHYEQRREQGDNVKVKKECMRK